MRRVALANAEPQLSLISQVESPNELTTTLSGQGNSSSALLVSNQDDYSGWIMDSGATDHMTFCPSDFVNTTKLKRTSIVNANGVTYPVTGAGTVALS